MDWDGDGELDILSGSYWTDGADGGHIQLLTGNGTLDFAEAVALKNSNGDPLQNTELSRELDSSGNPNNQIATICTHQCAVDYDDDGDLDLVVGCFGEQFYLHENTGTRSDPQFKRAVELPIRSTSQHSAPHLVDWDGDGDLDLLSGTSHGGAIISENTGTRAKPQWSPFRQLIPPSTWHVQSTARGEEIQPAPNTRVWATDWNGDGLLDLLVGDSTDIVNPKDGVSLADYERRLEKSDRKMADISARQTRVYTKLRENGPVDEDLEQQFQEQIQELSTEMSAAAKERAEFQDRQSTGFVWLYVRKP